MTSASCNWKYLKAIYEYLSKIEFNQLAFSVLDTNALCPDSLSKYIKIVSTQISPVNTLDFMYMYFKQSNVFK